MVKISDILLKKFLQIILFGLALVNFEIQFFLIIFFQGLSVELG